MKFTETLPKCWRCGHATVLDERVRPNEGKTHTLFFIRCGDPDCHSTGHVRQDKPGPWRLLQKSADSWSVGFKCPECGTPVEFKKRRRRADCPGCGCRVDRDGKTGVECDHCGKFHWTESSKGWCTLYKTLRGELGKELPTGFPEGSKEPPPWGDINAWNDIRDGMLGRDSHTCQDCGRCEMDILGDIMEAHGHPRDMSPMDVHDREMSKEISTNMALEVHHIVPRVAGGTNHPENLITLCRACHRARHDAIGDGYHPHFKVSLAIIRDDVVGEERAALLAGDHPILDQIHREKELRALPERERRLLTDIEAGAQKTLEVDG